MTRSESEARERLLDAINFTETANMGTTPDELLDEYRHAILGSAAEKIRDGDGARIEYGDPICNCPDLIDPDKQEQP